MAQNVPQITIDRLPGLKAKTGDARSTVYKKIAAGLWPRAVCLGGRSVGWPSSETEAILRARIAGKTDDEIRELVKQLEKARRDAA